MEPNDWVGLQRKLTIEGCSDSQYFTDSVMIFYIKRTPKKKTTKYNVELQKLFYVIFFGRFRKLRLGDEIKKWGLNWKIRDEKWKDGAGYCYLYL